MTIDLVISVIIGSGFNIAVVDITNLTISNVVEASLTIPNVVEAGLTRFVFVAIIFVSHLTIFVVMAVRITSVDVAATVFAIGAINIVILAASDVAALVFVDVASTVAELVDSVVVAAIVNANVSY